MKASLFIRGRLCIETEGGDPSLPLSTDYSFRYPITSLILTFSLVDLNKFEEQEELSKEEILTSLSDILNIFDIVQNFLYFFKHFSSN